MRDTRTSGLLNRAVPTMMMEREGMLSRGRLRRAEPSDLLKIGNLTP